MNVEIKRAVKAGNSSAVILPRAWLNKEVRIELIEKTPEIILLDVINILKKNINLKEVIGIYLAGSYARHEEEKDSDIDILVITNNIDKPQITEGLYNILVVSKQLINQKLEKDLFPIGQMIKESIPLLNSDYLSSIDVKVTKKNIKWYLDTTEEKIKLIEESLDSYKEKEKIDNKIIYTLILRLRTLDIIQKLIKNKDYSNKEFQKTIKRISGSSDAYESYLSEKNNLEEENRTSKEEAEKLLDYLKKQLEEVKI